MLIGFHLTVLVRGRADGGGEIAAPGIFVFVSGGADGVVQPNQTLTGSITGGTPGQEVTHQWLADGIPIPGETTPSFTPQPDDSLTLGADVVYAPIVAGQTYLSASMRYLPAVSVSVLGDFDGNALPGRLLTGTIAGLSADQFVLDRWTVNGQEIPAATRASFTPELTTLQPGDSIRYAPIVEGLSFPSEELILAEQVLTSLSGDVGGEIVAGGSLTGSVTGGFAGQTVVHQWTADGVVIAGAAAPTYVPMQGGGVTIGAALRYAPLVSGESVASSSVTLVASIAVSVTGDSAGVVAPGETLTGSVSGGYSGQVIVHRWSADGVILTGQSSPSLTVAPALGLPQGTVLRYAPLVGGQAYSSAPITVGGIDQSPWVFADIGSDSARLISSPTPPPALRASQITETSAFFEGL